MNTTNKTVLVTGGGSGIGFQIAKLFSEKGSKVIITGRNEEKLKSAAAKLQNVDYYVADVTNAANIESLITLIVANYPSLDVLINNAGNASIYQVGNGQDTFVKASEEIVTNYLSVVNLTEKLLPYLEKQAEPAVVNVTSIVAFAPSFLIPTYSASKAALRSYTQILRFTLEKKGSNVQVFELMPPLVNTDFSKDINGHKGIPPEEVAQELVRALESNTQEVRVGITEFVYSTFFAGSENAIPAIYQAEHGE
jgi:uncharacterized oxidoreductase